MEQEQTFHEFKTYSAQVSEFIKNELLEGRLKAGDKVNEAHLASSLSISRAPIREALQMLVNDGLIVSIPHKGKFIVTLTGQDIYNNYSMAGVLEAAAVSSCIDLLTGDDLAQLDAILDELADLDENSADYASRLAVLDAKFHNTIVIKAPNSLMAQVARQTCQRLSKFLLYRHWATTYTHAEVVARHREVLSALKTRDPHAIERVIRKHYDDLGECMRKFGCEFSSSCV